MMFEFKQIEVEEFTVSTGERSGTVFGYFASIEIGQKATKGKGFYGGDGTHTGTKTANVFIVDGEEYIFLEDSRINIFCSEEDVREAELEARRQQALSKLNEEDKRILGLD